MNTRKKFLQNTGPTLPGMEMLEIVESTISPKLISSVEASLAKISAKLIKSKLKDSMEDEADYGVSSTASFANYDPVTSSWKTSQLYFSGDLEEYSETWPKAGMMRNGRCSERVISVCLTDVDESLLLPTPQASDGDASLRARLNYASQIVRTGKSSEKRKKTVRWFHYAMYYHRLNRCYPNPRFVEWMMGFPIGWSELNDSEIASPLKWLSILEDVS